MELKSEPKYTEIPVTDIDIAFPGDLQTYTLRDGQDKFVANKDSMVISFFTGGTITFLTQHVHYFAIRPRSLRIVVPETPRTPNAE